MWMFLIIFEVAMLVSSIGFKKYVWFISLGYGFSVMVIGGVLLGAYWQHWNDTCLCIPDCLWCKAGRLSDDA